MPAAKWRTCWLLRGVTDMVRQRYGLRLSSSRLEVSIEPVCRGSPQLLEWPGFSPAMRHARCNHELQPLIVAGTLVIRLQRLAQRHGAARRDTRIVCPMEEQQGTRRGAGGDFRGMPNGVGTFRELPGGARPNLLR